MVLHRDIYWLGRQWAVTGYGIQACDQKRKGQFDVDGSRMWEDGVLDGVRALEWLNAEDFEKAVAVARKYYPEPPPGNSPVELGQPVLAPAEEVSPAPPPPPETFEMRTAGLRARLVKIWRIRARGSPR